ncbi:MAG TPA: hypothetical protein VHN99_09200, partial [Deinococcales bacterium]|nr:hypothetical protein [Deinococcales bacterium]
MATVIGEVQDLRQELHQALQAVATAAKPAPRPSTPAGPGLLTIEPVPAHEEPPAPARDEPATAAPGNAAPLAEVRPPQPLAPADPEAVSLPPAPYPEAGPEPVGVPPEATAVPEAEPALPAAPAEPEGFMEPEPAATHRIDPEVVAVRESTAEFDGFELDFDDLDEAPGAPGPRTALTETEIAELEAIRAHAERSVEATLRLEPDPFKSNVVPPEMEAPPATGAGEGLPAAAEPARPAAPESAASLFEEPERESFEARLARLRSEKQEERERIAREEAGTRGKSWLGRLFRR